MFIRNHLSGHVNLEMKLSVQGNYSDWKLMVLQLKTCELQYLVTIMIMTLAGGVNFTSGWGWGAGAVNMNTVLET